MIGWTMCSGIGAPEMAAQWIDWRLASEIEPFPRAVLQERFGYRDPETHNQGDPLLWGDMTEVTPDLARQRGVPLPDILVAGTPCQAFSIAGLRGGVDDERGNLTLKFVETCHAIVDARPDGKLKVVWENVPGVLSDKGNAFGCFLGGLVGAVDALPPPGDGSWPSEGMVSGPRARLAWSVLDARWFGVAQRRRRVFVVVDFGGSCDPAQILLEPDIVRGDRPTRGKEGQETAGFTETGFGKWIEGAGTLRAAGGSIGPGSEMLVQGHHGDIAGTVSAKWHKGSGGPSGDETQNLVAFDCKGTQVQYDASGVSPPLRSMGHKDSHTNGGGHAAIAIQERACADDLSQGPQGAGYRTDDTAYTLEARNKVQAVAFDLRGRDGGAQVESVGDTVSLRAADGGSSRSYVATVSGETTHALTGEGHDASEDGTGSGTPVVAFAQNQRDEVRIVEVVGAQSAAQAMKQQTFLSTPQVRRLTPTECARLQGFPDDHAAITFRGKPAADGNQYKAYGNSMAVPVMAWILYRMKG